MKGEVFLLIDDDHLGSLSHELFDCHSDFLIESGSEH